MSAPIHFSRHKSITDAIVDFSKLCRESSIPIGISHTLEAIDASKMGFINCQSTFRHTLKSIYCTRIEEHELFDKCFDVYWTKRKHHYAHKIDKMYSNIIKSSRSSIAMIGFNHNKHQEKKNQEKEEAKSVTGASRIEALKHTDFSRIASIDNEYLDQLTNRLLQQLNHRLKRKQENAKRGKIDIRRTIRNNISNGSDLIDLSKRNRKHEKNKLILLLDVSGSMDKYSFYLLKFIWSLKTHLKNIEAFIFSTHLIRITEIIREDQVKKAMLQMNAYVSNWSGGTKIGECLQSFNDEYAKRILNGRSITIILSDGLDDGSPNLIATEIEKIKMRTNKLIWLNPLKGMINYEPLAKGMAVALPLLDDFRSAHNLSSLLELEDILAHA